MPGQYYEPGLWVEALMPNGEIVHGEIVSNRAAFWEGNGRPYAIHYFVGDVKTEGYPLEVKPVERERSTAERPTWEQLKDIASQMKKAKRKRKTRA